MILYQDKHHHICIRANNEKISFGGTIYRVNTIIIIQHFITVIVGDTFYTIFVIVKSVLPFWIV